MSVRDKKQEADDSVPVESDFEDEELSVENDWSLTEREGDLEATVRAIQDRAEASAAAAAAPRPKATSTTHQPEAVDEFLCNFLAQMGMTETLDCFQTEWNEMAHKGLLDTKRVAVVPDVYTENKRLDSELKNVRREAEEFGLAASAAVETLLRVQKARDFHQMQHRRVVQEKNRVIEEMRKLKAQCDNYDLAVKRMTEKLQTLLRQTTLVTLERDKAVGRANPQSAQRTIPFSGDTGDETAVNGTGALSVKGTTHPVIQPRPSTSANIPGVRPGCSQ